jgi:GT2 family glycosyltransferase
VIVEVHEHNRGVTETLNTCLRLARTPLVGLFNNDVELDPGCLQELVDALDRHPEAGWAGGKLLDFRERDVIDGAGDLFTWAATGGRRGHGERDRGQYDEPRAIFGACGGAAVYRREVLDEVGLFDEEFHALYEDVDWDLRAQLAGYSCRYVPSAVVYHMGSATIGRGLNDFNRYHMCRNSVWIVVKDLPLAAIVRHLPQLVLGQVANLAVAVRDGKVVVWLRAMRDATLALPRVLRKRREVHAPARGRASARRHDRPRRRTLDLAGRGAEAEGRAQRTREHLAQLRGEASDETQAEEVDEAAHHRPDHRVHWQEQARRRRDAGCEQDERGVIEPQGDARRGAGQQHCLADRERGL